MKPTLFILAAVSLALAGAPAHAEIVVVVNLKNPATRMFSAQAAQFFLGKSAMFTPVDQADDSGIRNEFYKKCAGKDAAEVTAIWSKIVFTGKGRPPKVHASGADVKKAVAADVNAIGYIDKAELDDTVKAVLSLP
ncbi:MAG: hypothetical protein V4857_11750 [Pseudomonadota bacterium]